MPPKPKPSTSPHTPIHPYYALALLTLEPLTALAGAIAAAATPTAYLHMTHAASAPSAATAAPLATGTALAQLANLYALFAVNEALVLRAASSRAAGGSTRAVGSGKRGAGSAKHDAANSGAWAWLVPVRGVAVDVGVWRALLFGLLLADLGHLWSVAGLGAQVYWRVWGWSAMDFGNVGIVYVGIVTRVCFLLGVGVG